MRSYRVIVLFETRATQMSFVLGQIEELLEFTQAAYSKNYPEGRVVEITETIEEEVP